MQGKLCAARIVKAVAITREDAEANFPEVLGRCKAVIQAEDAKDDEKADEEFQRLVIIVQRVFTGMSRADVRKFLETHEAAVRHGGISAENFFHFFGSIQPMGQEEVEIDLQALTTAHQRTRDSLVDELARLHFEFEESQAFEKSEARKTNKNAQEIIWNIIRQCQIRDQIQEKGVSKLELTQSAHCMFDIIDTNKNGFLSESEVRQALNGFGVTFVDQAIAHMGTDKEINLAQFEAGLVPLLQRFLLQKEVRKLKLRHRRHRLAAQKAREREEREEITLMPGGKALLAGKKTQADEDKRKVGSGDGQGLNGSSVDCSDSDTDSD